MGFDVERIVENLEGLDPSCFAFELLKTYPSGFLAQLEVGSRRNNIRRMEPVDRRNVDVKLSVA